MNTSLFYLGNRLFIQLCLIVGYLLFGYVWTDTLVTGITANHFFEIFPIEETKVDDIAFQRIKEQEEKRKVTFTYNVEHKEYTKELSVNLESFRKKVGLDENELIVCFNKFIPSASYLKNWKLDSYYKFIFILFSFFFGLMFVADYHINRDHFLRHWFKSIFIK